MNSFEELNNRGRINITVNDLRPAGVVFDRQLPLKPFDVAVDFPSANDGQILAYVTSGIEILEIINYAVADVNYNITLVTTGSPELSFDNDSFITFQTIPEGLVVERIGNTYSVAGLRSSSDWQQLRAFFWSLPEDLSNFPNFNLEVEIDYYDQAQDQRISKKWIVFDQDYYYFAELKSEFTLNASAQRTILFNDIVFEQSYFDLYLEDNGIRGGRSNMVSTFTVFADGEDRILGSSNISSTSQLSCVAVKQTNTSLALTSTSIITANVDRLEKLTNMITSLNYEDARPNKVFNSLSLPKIDTPSTATVTLEFYHRGATHGHFGVANEIVNRDGDRYTITGTGANINSFWDNIYFWPSQFGSSTTPTTFKYKQYINNNLVVDLDIPLTRVGKFNETLIFSITNPGSGQVFFNYKERYYYGMKFLLIGGGGGGGGATTAITARRGGRGGAGGSIKEPSYSSTRIQLGSNFSYTVGAGGAINATTTQNFGGTTSITYTPSSGGSALTFTAPGGGSGIGEGVGAGANGTYIRPNNTTIAGTSGTTTGNYFDSNIVLGEGNSTTLPTASQFNGLSVGQGLSPGGYSGILVDDLSFDYPINPPTTQTYSPKPTPVKTAAGAGGNGAVYLRNKFGTVNESRNSTSGISGAIFIEMKT
jgi:hypothetical protein